MEVRMRNPLCLLAALVLGCGGAPEASAGAQPNAVGDVGGEGSGAEAADCSFAGRWAGTFVGGPYEGRDMTWSFTDDGTVRWASGELAFEGTWSIADRVVSVTDTSESGCTGVTGTFSVDYRSDCDEVVIATVEDACAPRTVSTDGMTLTRD